ncbi:AAA family ATPase [Myroides albus]|uniref:ATP-binding protein n=1 Tax=Myroides albus TaxID=2562892 RepID=UPI002158D3FD|nr:AAA family ATPase [Myroides albus]UVD79273.1 AAA family ATPase [Myroides albus]
MVIEVGIEENGDNFEQRLVKLLRTTLEDRYILLRSSSSFKVFIDSFNIVGLSIGNDTLYISNYLRKNKKDFNELITFIKLIGVNGLINNLLIIEIDRIDEIKKIYKEAKKSDIIEDNNTLVKTVKPKFCLDDVILNESEINDIRSSLILIENRELIYDKWGFSEIDNKPRLILNFFGVPGTGKTMSAHAVASELKKNILLINYSDIESKFVGDAPKNLVKVFEEARNTDSVLFFDEADSFLGKRIESVSASSDQAINSLRSQMLILLEDFEGVVIFATNLVENYDKAFESRILKHIEFSLPNLENRVKILDRMLVNKIPIDKHIDRGLLLHELSIISEGFSGREIKNALLECLTLAAYKNENILSEKLFTDNFRAFSKKKISLNTDKRNFLPEEVKKKLTDKIKQNITS